MQKIRAAAFKILEEYGRMQGMEIKELKEAIQKLEDSQRTENRSTREYLLQHI